MVKQWLREIISKIKTTKNIGPKDTLGNFLYTTGRETVIRESLSITKIWKENNKSVTKEIK